MRVPRPIAVLTVAALLRPPCLRAQSHGGTLIERVRSAVDTGQSYAVFLPNGFTNERTWPVLFLLDPRGRALTALDLFRAGAARLGWIVVSSYSSRSDGPVDANVHAMNAMLAAVQGLNTDTSRLYLAGFSGTARDALRFAVQLRGRVAGVIAIGGALRFEIGGPETAFAKDQRFAYFGGVGDIDFNHEEVRRMGEAFRRLQVPSRVVVFRGPHRWPPQAICEEALDWLELRAMFSGLRPIDSAWARFRFERDRVRLAGLERGGQWDAALRLAQEVADDFAGWPGIDSITVHAARLREHPIMRRYQDERRRLAEIDARQGAELLEKIAWARRQQPIPSVPTLAAKLEIPRLLERAERGDSLQALSARRLLARTSVFLSFYVPREEITDRAPERALRMLETARLIGPIEGEACGQLRQAVAMSGRAPPVSLAGECANQP